MHIAEEIRVLLLMKGGMFWQRGALRGFHELALERGWTVLSHPADDNLPALLRDWDPQAVVLGPQGPRQLPAELRGRILVIANDDRTAEGLASVTVDEEAVGAAAADHLLACGLRHLTAFLYSDSAFAQARAKGFRARAAAAAPGVWLDGRGQFSNREHDPTYARHEAVLEWVRHLPKPCGIFACCDTWAHWLGNYCRNLRLAVPEQVALLGVDNDALECELMAPPLSSVAIPWQQLGQRVAELVDQGLQGRVLPVGRAVLIQPSGVVARRSTDVLAINDPDVAAAAAFIRANAHHPLAVPDVLRAVPVFRRTLQRHFRAVLGRTISDEIRRAHVEVAKRLLATTELTMPEVARNSGFSNATLLGVAFRREAGMTPSAYRRSFAAEADPAMQGSPGL